MKPNFWHRVAAREFNRFDTSCGLNFVAQDRDVKSLPYADGSPVDYCARCRRSLQPGVLDQKTLAPVYARRSQPRGE